MKRIFAVTALALLLMVSVTEQQQQNEMVPSDFENEACKENLSTILAATSQRKHSLKNQRSEIARLRNILKFAVDREEILENEIDNFTAQIQELEGECTGFLPLDCCQIKIVNSSAETGPYEIRDPCAGDKAFNYAKIHVRCDMETDDGGWIVIQRRIANGTVNFTRNWEDYENGFGDLDGEFWIGLKNMHELTKQPVELQVTVWNDDDDTITWNYSSFIVANAGSSYRLTVSGSTGDGGTNGLAYSNRAYFSTFDRDNSFRNCASTYQGGWWYRYHGGSFPKDCTNGNLNGRHESSGLSDNTIARLYWGTRGKTYANSEMKIRSKTCGLGG